MSSTAITAVMVKELREKTNAAMMDCKKALEECNGNMEEAIDWLRQKGLAKAAKKSDRETKEGVVLVHITDDGSKATLASLQCETDFVARNEAFTALATEVAQAISQTQDMESIQGKVQEAIVTLGENITIGKSVSFALGGKSELGVYIHSNAKVGAMVELETDVRNPAIQELAKDLAMQVVATKPQAITASELSHEVVEREKEVFRVKAQEEGKPQNIIEKIVEGAIKKFYSEACLLNQSFIKDPNMTVEALVNKVAKENNTSIVIKRFDYISLI